MIIRMNKQLINMKGIANTREPIVIFGSFGEVI